MTSHSNYLSSAYIEDPSLFSWPVNRQKMVDVRNRFISCVLDIYKADNHNMVSYYPILCIHWANYIMQCYDGVIRSKNIDGEALSAFSLALSKGELPALPKHFNSFKSGPQPPCKYKAPLRYIRNHLVRDGIKRVSPHRLDFKNDIVVSSIGSLINDHANKISDNVFYVPRSYWFKPIDEVPPDILEESNDLWQCVLDAFGDEQHVLEGSPAESWFKDVFTHSLFYCDVHMRRLEAQPDTIPAHLWIGSGSIIWDRMVKRVVTRNGGHITGHDHGSGTGHLLSVSRTLAECSDCDVFVGFSKTPDLFMDILDHNFIFDGVPKIKPLAYKSKNITKHNIGRKDGKVILVLPAAPSGDTPRFVGADSEAVNTDFLNRLLLALVEYGYDVLLKPHPTFPPLLNKNYLDKIGVKTVSGSIDDAFELADIVLFQHIHTTTFREALEQNKHIAVVDMRYDPWVLAALEQVHKRCSLLPVHYDDKNRIQLDWKNLSEQIERAREKTDNAFFDMYYS